MVLLSPTCASRRPTVKEKQSVFSRTGQGGNLLGATPRNPGHSRSARRDMDVEPYSSAILQPLTAACVFRDCSLRLQSSPPERRACRTLMREAAIKWRQGLAMGDL
jgi:hypothetical protein